VGKAATNDEGSAFYTKALIYERRGFPISNAAGDNRKDQTKPLKPSILRVIGNYTTRTSERDCGCSKQICKSQIPKEIVKKGELSISLDSLVFPNY
jgi:hypothetical protein